MQFVVIIIMCIKGNIRKLHAHNARDLRVYNRARQLLQHLKLMVVSNPGDGVTAAG